MKTTPGSQHDRIDRSSVENKALRCAAPAESDRSPDGDAPRAPAPTCHEHDRAPERHQTRDITGSGFHQNGNGTGT